MITDDNVGTRSASLAMRNVANLGDRSDPLSGSDGDSELTFLRSRGISGLLVPIDWNLRSGG